MRTDYSEKEFAMVQACSPHWAMIVCLPHLQFNPVSVLECVMKEVFLENKQGPAVESLRRCLREFNYNRVYRMTPEYDALIQLNNDNHSYAMESAFGCHGQG